MTLNSRTGAVFITSGAITGAGISTTVGGMGLAGGFGAVGIGTVPVVGAGAVVGAAAYGACKAFGEGDAGAFAAMGIGALGGAGVSSVVGTMGIVAPKIGLAFGIGTAPLAAAGAVVGLAAYGVAKLLEESETRETPVEVFNRMEAKVLHMEAYTAALMELDALLASKDLEQKFAALIIEEELAALKAELREEAANNSPEISSEIVSLTNQSPETWRCVQTFKGHTAGVNAIAISPDGQTLASSSTNVIIKLWHLPTGELLQNLSGQSPIAFTSDGKTLVSAGKGGTIKIWRQVLGNDDSSITPILLGEWWEILGVNEWDNHDDIKLAYYRLSRQYYPDIIAVPNHMKYIIAPPCLRGGVGGGVLLYLTRTGSAITILLLPTPKCKQLIVLIKNSSSNYKSFNLCKFLIFFPQKHIRMA